MVEKCIRCGVRGDSVMIYDAIYNGEMGYLCERCSIIENVPIIKKPTSTQLKDSEKKPKVYDRMKAMMGEQKQERVEIFSPKARLKEIEKNPNLEYPSEEKLNLIEHFEWELIKIRRRKGYSHRQLADAVNESEIALQMIEKGKFPGNALSIIIKLEQFFQVKFRKTSYYDEINRNKRKEPVLFDSRGRALERIPEPDVVCTTEIKVDSETPLLNGMEVTECRVETKEKNNGEKFWKKPITKYLEFRKKEKERKENLKNEEANEAEEKIEEIKKEGLDETNGTIDLNKVDQKQVTIADLNRLHRKKLEVSKQDRVEEQRRIEERQKLIEARKEELRQKKEKEARDVDSILGGTELLGKK